MNRKPTRPTLRSTALVLGGIALASAAGAATFTWTQTAAGTYNWDDATSNWTAGYPNAAGDTASLTSNIVGDETVNLNQAITLGRLNIGDASTTSNVFTIMGNGGSFIFDNGPLQSVINQSSKTKGDVIAADILIAGTRGMQVTSDTYVQKNLTISGNISGAGPLELNHASTNAGWGVILSGSNSYTGGTRITFGTMTLGSANALPTTGSVTFAGAYSVLKLFDGADLSGRFSQAENQYYGIDTNGQNVTFNTALTSAGGRLTKNGNGTLTLAAANSYTGLTSITSGTLTFSGAGTLGSTTAALNMSGGVFDLANAPRTIGDLNTTGAATVQNGTLTGAYYNIISSATVTANLAGDGVRLTKGNSGTLTLGGTNTYTGTTTILGGGAIALNFAAATAPTANIISNSSALVMNGGTLTLNGGKTAGAAYSQTFDSFTLNPGAAAFTIVNGTSAAATALNLGAINRSAGATASFAQPTGNATISSTNGYTASTSNDASGILGGWATISGTTWAANNGTNLVAYTGYTDLSGADPSLADGAATNVRITNGSTGNIGQATGITTVNTLLVNDTTIRTITIGAGNTLRLGAAGGVLTTATSLVIGASGNGGTLTAGGADDTAGEIIFTNAKDVTVNAVIADNGTGKVAVTKSGAGTLTLSGTQAYTGGTFLNAGTLTLSAGTNVLDQTGDIVVSGGTLNLGGGSLTTSGAVSLRNGTITSGTITKNNGNFETWAGTSTGKLAGSAGLTKLTSGTLNLQAANSYTGDTVILEGRIISGTNSSSYTVVAGNLIVGSPDGGPAASYGVAQNAVTMLNNKNVTVYSNGVVDFGNGAQNLYSGTYKIIGGTLQGSQIYTSAATLFQMTGGTLAGSFNSSSFTVTSLANSTPANVSANTNGGGITFNVADGAAAVDLNYTGVISGASFMVKDGAGLMTVSGMGSYTGTTTVKGGILSVDTLNNGGVISNIGASTNAAANLVLNGGTLRYTGPVAATDRLFTLGTTAGSTLDASGAGAVSFTNTGAIVLSGTNTARTFTLTGSNTGDNTLAAVLGNNGTGKTSLVKNGAGKWVLSGANLYTGTTTVNDGILAIGASGSINTTAGVVLNGGELKYNSATALTAPVTFTGGKLSGTGSINTAVTVGAGATLSPGNSPGSQSFTDLTWTTGGAYLWEINDQTGTAGADPGWDLINVSGALDISGLSSSGTFNIDVTGLTGVGTAPAATTTWTILNYGTLNGTFNDNLFTLNPTGFGDSWTGTWSIADTGSSLQLTYSVPEPAMLALLGLGGLALLRRRRNG